MLDYREAFANYDKNGDGTIDENELMYVMRSLGENPSEDQMAYIMHEVSRLFIDHKIINEAQKKVLLIYIFNTVVTIFFTAFDHWMVNLG